MLKNSEKMKVKLEADVETLAQQVDELTREIKGNGELKGEMETSKLENRELLKKLEEVQKQHSEAVMKLKQAEDAIEGMDKFEGVHKMLEESQQRVLKLEDELEAAQGEGGRSKEELERKCCQVTELEGEIKDLTEQLEESEKNLHDKSNQLVHLEQIRKEEEALILAKEEELSTLKNNLIKCQEERVGVEEVEALSKRVESITKEFSEKSEEAEQLSIARDLLLAQLQEQGDENRNMVEQLEKAEGRLQALQVYV